MWCCCSSWPRSKQTDVLRKVLCGSSSSLVCDDEPVLLGLFFCRAFDSLSLSFSSKKDRSSEKRIKSFGNFSSQTSWTINANQAFWNVCFGWVEHFALQFCFSSCYIVLLLLPSVSARRFANWVSALQFCGLLVACVVLRDRICWFENKKKRAFFLLLVSSSSSTVGSLFQCIRISLSLSLLTFSPNFVLTSLLSPLSPFPLSSWELLFSMVFTSFFAVQTCHRRWERKKNHFRCRLRSAMVLRIHGWLKRSKTKKWDELVFQGLRNWKQQGANVLYSKTPGDKDGAVCGLTRGVLCLYFFWPSLVSFQLSCVPWGFFPSLSLSSFPLPFDSLFYGCAPFSL